MENSQKSEWLSRCDEVAVGLIRDAKVLEFQLAVLKNKIRCGEPAGSEIPRLGAKKTEVIEPKNEIIGKQELAKRLGKSFRWIEMQCSDGVLPSIKIKRSIFFNWESVVASLKARSTGGVVRRY